ncbi:hypothetical protein [Pantoea conspicua]|nr:hypothetical protein [Pantoea conspicua]
MSNLTIALYKTVCRGNNQLTVEHPQHNQPLEAPVRLISSGLTVSIKKGG